MAKRTALRIVLTCGGRLKHAMRGISPGNVKALLKSGGISLLERAVAAALGIEDSQADESADTAIELSGLIAVGPPDVANEIERISDSLRPDIAVHYAAEGSTLLDNIVIGVKASIGEGEAEKSLIVSPDLPFINSESICDFLKGVPKDAELALPAVTKEDFLKEFPGAKNRFNRLKEGNLTLGSVIFARTSAITANTGLFQDAHNARKNPAKLAGMLGPAFIFKYLAGTLSVKDAETRLSLITGAKTHAVMNSSPLLAFDIDNEIDYEYAERLHSAKLGV